MIYSRIDDGHFFRNEIWHSARDIRGSLYDMIKQVLGNIVWFNVVRFLLNCKLCFHLVWNSWEVTKVTKTANWKSLQLSCVYYKRKEIKWIFFSQSNKYLLPTFLLFTCLPRKSSQGGKNYFCKVKIVQLLTSSKNQKISFIGIS